MLAGKRVVYEYQPRTAFNLHTQQIQRSHTQLQLEMMLSHIHYRNFTYQLRPQ